MTKNYANMVATAILGDAMTLGGYKLFMDKHDAKQGALKLLSHPAVVQTNYNAADGEFELKEDSFIEAANKTMDSMVHVKNTVKSQGITSIFDLFYGNGGGEQAQVGTDSGMIITPDGYIVTNDHVVAGATTLEVTLDNNKTCPAKLIGTDTSTDIALLKIEVEEKLPFLTFTSSDNTQLGEWVLTIGNPFNLNSTVTAGIVSAKAYSINERGSDKIGSFIQTDAAVNVGNSGGVLVNLNGDLISINTAVSSATGMYMGYSFAIPSNITKKVVENLTEYGNMQRGVMDVRGQELDSEVAKILNVKETGGSYVTNVEKDSGTGAAGFKKGDIIKQLGSVRIHAYSDLNGYIASKRPGDVLKATYIRDGKEKATDVILKKGNTYIIQSLGLEVGNLSEADRKRFKTRAGIRVTGAGQFYEYSNINIVDKVLLSINGKAIKDVDELKSIVAGLSARDHNSLKILNDEEERERLFF